MRMQWGQFSLKMSQPGYKHMFIWMRIGIPCHKHMLKFRGTKIVKLFLIVQKQSIPFNKEMIGMLHQLSASWIKFIFSRNYYMLQIAYIVMYYCFPKLFIFTYLQKHIHKVQILQSFFLKGRNLFLYTVHICMVLSNGSHFST